MANEEGKERYLKVVGGGLKWEKPRALKWVAEYTSGAKTRGRKRKLETSSKNTISASETLQPPAYGRDSRGESSEGYIGEKRKRSRQSMALRIWTPEMHLALKSRAARYIQMFAKTSMTLIHPALLQEDNLDWFLTCEGSTISTPLSFNLTMAICSGAWACGDEEVAMEHWQKARNQIADLFDLSDFHVATGLMMMSSYCCYNPQLATQGVYYATLGASICERVDCYNPVYMVLLSQMTLYEYSSQNWEVYYQKCLSVKTRPHAVTDLVSTQKGNQLSVEKEDKAPARWLNPDLELDGIFHDLMLNLMIIFMELTAREGPSADSEDSYILSQYHAELQYLGEGWAKIRHIFRPAQELLVGLVFATTTTVALRTMARREQALISACTFLDLTEDPLFPYLRIPTEVAATAPLMVFYESNNLFCLHKLVLRLFPRYAGCFLTGTLKKYFDRALEYAHEAGLTPLTQLLTDSSYVQTPSSSSASSSIQDHDRFFPAP